MKKLVLLFLALVFAVPCLAETSDPFVGQWQDPYYGRALLEINQAGGNYDISIHWGNSADSEGVWEMDATREGNSLVYTSGKMSIITYAEGGDVVYDDIQYEDAEGAFTLGDDGKLYWTDSREDRAQDFALERVEAVPLSGGWTPSADPTITDELKSIFEAGTDTLTGIAYVPVAYLGSQVVAGTNHAFLCQTTSAYPGVEGLESKPGYAMVYLYEDLSGNVSILSIADFDVGAYCEYGSVDDTVALANAAPAEEATADDTVAAAAVDAPDEEAESDALAEALEALHKARMEKAQEELKAELDEYVAAGKLTQEQVDLIMKHFQDMERDDRPGGDYFGGWMNGDQCGGKYNHMGGQKQYGNWQFGWSFDWHFPGQDGEDNPFRDMFGGNHM